jgi:hypothetical protein
MIAGTITSTAACLPACPPGLYLLYLFGDINWPPATCLPPAAAGVIRVGGDGRSQATAASQECLAVAFELRMPVMGTE